MGTEIESEEARTWRFWCCNDADPLTHYKKEVHAGVYIGDGEFVASVRGASVAILKLSEGAMEGGVSSRSTDRTGGASTRRNPRDQRPRKPRHEP
jgi:hypothetical protein